MIRHRIFAVLAAGFFAAALGLGALPARADTDYALTISCSVNEMPLVDMDWTIYHCGENTSNGYELSGEFEGLPVDVGGHMTTSEVIDAASTLENYAIIYGFEDCGSGSTDETGELVIDDLEEGVYLVCGRSIQLDRIYYIPCPFLLSVTEDTTYYLVYPKYDILDWYNSTGSGDKMYYSVTKVWEDAENASLSRPSSVDVEIYRDGESYYSVTLDESNDWTFSWSASTYHDWRTIETNVPDGYSVVYRSDEQQYVIVNTNGDTTITTTAATTETDIENGTTTTTTDGGGTTDLTVTVTTTGTGTDTKTDTDNSTTTGLDSTEPPGLLTVTTTTRTNSGGGGGDSSSSSTSGKLPQTGLLWWPVPILTALGLICLFIGWRLRKRE